jgi:transcriptional regulator with XRE-family HTH domain
MVSEHEQRLTTRKEGDRMPRATPKRSGRQAKPGSRFPGEIVAENVRTWRGVRRLSQAQLAARMSSLGHRWTESIVGFVERGQRNVTVDEYIGLHFALELDDFGALLDPLGIEGEMRPYGPYDKIDAPGLDYGGPEPLPAEYISRWRHGRVTARGVWTNDRIKFVFGGSTEVAEGSVDEP